MTDSIIYKVLKQIDKGRVDIKKHSLIFQKMEELGFANPITENDKIKSYKLTIKGKIFIWDSEHWRL